MAKEVKKKKVLAIVDGERKVITIDEYLELSNKDKPKGKGRGKNKEVEVEEVEAKEVEAGE